MTKLSKLSWHHTTVVCVRRGESVAMGSDGQVTLGSSVLKAGARKVQRLGGGSVIAGFAGSVADAMALFARFDAKLEAYGGNLRRAAVELARDWRTDRVLRRLEAMLLTADKTATLLISGTGEVIEPDDEVIAIGSGGGYALAAARALTGATDMGASDIVRRSLEIAASIDIYTNDHISLEIIE